MTEASGPATVKTPPSAASTASAAIRRSGMRRRRLRAVRVPGRRITRVSCPVIGIAVVW